MSNQMVNYLNTIITPLIKRRMDMALSQEELNDQLGLAKGQVAEWEDGTLMPDLNELQNWMKALDLRSELISTD